MRGLQGQYRGPKGPQNLLGSVQNSAESSGIALCSRGTRGWRRDGRELGGREPGEHHDIWLMNADGTDQRRVTPEFGQFVTWSTPRLADRRLSDRRVEHTVA